MEQRSSPTAPPSKSTKSSTAPATNPPTPSGTQQLTADLCTTTKQTYCSTTTNTPSSMTFPPSASSVYHESSPSAPLNTKQSPWHDYGPVEALGRFHQRANGRNGGRSGGSSVWSSGGSSTRLIGRMGRRWSGSGHCFRWRDCRFLKGRGDIRRCWIRIPDGRLSM